MRPPLLEHPGPFEPFDERDTVFARTRLVAGTDLCDEYYARRPEHRSADDRTRALPPLASRGGRRYRPEEAALVEAAFDASDLVAEAVERGDGRGDGAAVPDGLGVPARIAGDGPRHVLPDSTPAGLSRFVRGAARFLGAADVGIAPLDPGFVYTHRGRPTRRFGEPVALDHRFAVVLVFPMRAAYVAAGPEMAATAETAVVYQQAAAACFGLANALERLGVPARAHVDSNYLVIAPPLAELAGLGEVGRSGILVHRTLGPAVRLGVVTTSADLVPDVRTGHGIGAFCRVCGKCAENCPSGSIPRGDPVVVRGALKWPLAPERCYHYWRTQGTDCGVCLRACPFAKADSLLHRTVRAVVRRATAWNRFLLRCDDLLYGAKAPPRPPPLLGIGPTAPPGP